MSTSSEIGSESDIDLEEFKDGRFFILGLIAWIASIQVADVIIPLLRSGLSAAPRSVPSLVLVSVILYLLYRGKNLGRILVLIVMVATSLMGIYRVAIGYPGYSTLRMIHAGLLLVGAAALWFWKPVQTFLVAQRKGIDPRRQTTNPPDDMS
jgi:hypothetical protein